jgi:hypothetical protein
VCEDLGGGETGLGHARRAALIQADTVTPAGPLKDKVFRLTVFA